MRFASQWMLPGMAALLAGSVAVGAAAAAAPAGPAAPPPATCPICLLWDRYAEDFARVSVEAGALPDGAVYYLSSSTFRVVESIQRFAYERGTLEGEAAAAAHRSHRGEGDLPGVRLVVAASAHGIFAVLSSPDPAEARALREEASFATRSHRPPRF
jgi:hypothetical protein